MKYRLSRLLPLPFRSTYRIAEIQARRLAPDHAVVPGRTAFQLRGEPVELSTDGAVQRVTSTWWQFRGRVWRHRLTFA